ncbi:MAG: aminoglycoside phosphotransferase family protein [Alphaproteobacteria bacterium]
MNKENCLKLLQDLYPEKVITFIGAGWSSMAFDVDDEYIIRVPFVDVSQYKKEAQLQPFLQDKVSVLIPEPQVVETKDVSFAIHKKIKGLSWNLDTYNKLTKEEQNLFCEDIAKFFYEIHSVDLTELFANVDKKHFSPYLLEPKYNFFQYLKNSLSSKEIEDLYNWCEHVLNDKDKSFLIYEDFSPSNCLVDENHRLIGVFDFANAGINDIHEDFKRLHCSGFLDLLNNVLDYYKKMTGIEVDTEKLNNLNYANIILCLQYLAQNPNVVESDKSAWDNQIEKAKQLLQKISA